MTDARAAGTREGRCAGHPDRSPIGACRICRSLVCDECQMRLDGILHCRRCLGQVARALDAPRPSPAGRVAAACVALVLLAPALLAARAALKGAGFLAGHASRLRAVAPAPDDGTGPK